jgi:hypothetical protein
VGIKILIVLAIAVTLSTDHRLELRGMISADPAIIGTIGGP